ncbi:MAG TPA: twin-arginine translocation signal domain-containing protein [Thermoguttaceae bacterium]|nr:twin-arginine translocation signal domain-containing protein [Thermoguttaceae bacterium]
MSHCHALASCHGCCHAIDRRRFLQGCGAAAAAGSLAPLAGAAAGEQGGGKVRVAAVFLASMNTREIWPYPDFDTKGRQREVLARLRQGCPQIEFVPVTVETGADVQKAIALKDEVDGYLLYAMTLVWGQRAQLVELARLGKPTVVADEFLGGSGVFLTGFSQLCSAGVAAAGVSSTRLDDLVVVARQFATVRQPGTTPASFARQCERVCRETFPAAGELECADDSVTLTDVGRCVERFRQSRFLIVGRGRGGQELDFLGAKGRFVDFDELNAFYEKIDRDEAAEWAARWSEQADPLPSGDYVEPSRPTPDAVHKAGGVYLATLKLLEKHDTDSVTMNCLGGFSQGKLPSYPCLGFMQLLNDGGQGVCEAMPDDTLSMLMARILTGRPGFVSDPALDTSKNHVIYAHCVGTTKVFGPEGESNGFRIRTLHNRDPRGACAESMMPAGYMTTSFRTSVGRKQMVIHQAKALGPLETERGCRTKLIGEVCGDVGKLFDQWDLFGWHRVTVYGDVKEPLAEFGRALGLEVIDEA